MTTTPDHDPLKRFTIDKDAILIDNLEKALLSGNRSDKEMAKAVAVRNCDNSANLLPNDIARIFSFLAANLDYENNTYRKWADVKVIDKYGEKNEEVQESLRDWLLDIGIAKAKKG